MAITLKNIVAQMETIYSLKVSGAIETDIYYFVSFLSINKLFIVNKHGEVVREHDVHATLCVCGAIIRDYKTFKHGLIGCNGEVEFGYDYNSLHCICHNRLCAAKFNNGNLITGIIDSQNRVIVPFKYNSIVYCFDDKCITSRVVGYRKEEYRICNLNGQFLTKRSYPNIRCYNNLFIVERNGRTGVLNKNCEKTVPFICTEVYFLVNGALSYKRGGKLKGEKCI